ncbi:MAG: hypothetical protein GY854_14990 [Deltaproteobacteria bacterium]|nr:hypothetical protein [Deltaproteobacteria bacterium]
MSRERTNDTGPARLEDWRERNRREARESKSKHQRWVPRVVNTVNEAERAITGGFRVDAMTLLRNETLYRKSILLRSAHRVHNNPAQMAYLLNISGTAVKKWIKECGLQDDFFRADRDAARVGMGLAHKNQENGKL